MYNLTSHRSLRRQLRRTATPAEQRLWRFLKNDRLHGWRFRRQFGIGRYIVDFYCPKLRLAVEIDGQVHQESATKLNDEIRQKFLESCFIRVVRFTNSEVMNDTEGVIETLGKIVTFPSASPYPPSEFRRGTPGGS
ncbi:MAG: endonuclease domain-containing protein, partial [Patescibacteria group bacterium]